MANPKAYQIAIKPETTVGTAIVATMQLLNVDSYILPDSEIVIMNDLRQGVGSIAKTVDNFECQKGVLKTYTINGIADTTTLKLLISNALSIAISTAPASFDAPFNYSSPSIDHGDAGSTIVNTFTLALASPLSNTSIIQPGCVITNLVISAGGIGEENARVKFSATIVSRYIETRNSAIPTSMAAYTNAFYYASQFTATKTVADAADSIIDGFSFTIDNPTAFNGFQGANGDPENIERGVNELVITSTITVKHTTATDVIIQQYGDQDSGKVTELSNNATWASATGFGFRGIDGVVVEEPAVNEKSSMYIDVTQKYLANTSGDAMQIIA